MKLYHGSSVQVREPKVWGVIRYTHSIFCQMKIEIII